MAGYQAVLALHRLEEDVDRLGFVLCDPKTGWGGGDFNNLAGIRPKDADSLPVYSRDAEIFRGTLEEIRVWVQGVHWAREYDMMLRLSDEKNRVKKEDDHRHAELVRKLKTNHSKEQVNE